MKFRYAALTILNTLFVFGLFCMSSKTALAAEYQNCTENSNCTIGEFLYDDNYSPIATASCSLTSRYPDGSLFVNSATMSASSNGWYSYSAAIGATEGIYPTQICCSPSPEYLCLDKTFKVVPLSTSGGTSLTAADIWSYPNRSLTSFGTLVSDIWNYSSRSLTNFGDLVSNIWSNNGRSLTDSTNVSTTITFANVNDINEIKKVTKENRLLLEQLINKPIVKNFIDESPAPSLSSKLEQTKTAASNLYSSIQNLKSRAGILAEKWPTLSTEEVKAELSQLSLLFRQEFNQKDSNLITTTNWLKTSWDSPIFLNLSDQALAAQSNIDNLLNDFNLYQKTKTADALAPTLSHIQYLNDLVGTPFAPSDDLSLYGYLKKTTERITLLDKASADGQSLYSEIKKDSTKDHTGEIDKLSSDILSLNTVPQAESFLNGSTHNINIAGNKVLGLIALIDSNKLLMANNTGQTIKSIWLEEGSIIFRSVAINPSSSISQKVTIKFFLPTEVKKEQIINHDPELTIAYDPVENALFASGEVTLRPQQTRTFLVEVEDIWSFKQEEIDGLKTQTNELVDSLKNTPLYTQAISTKTDINVTLDKIMLRQKEAITPENRIRTFRESSLEINGVEEKINSLKTLIAQSNNSGNFLGLGGNIRPYALWGIVLAIIVGFAFLMFYVNAIRSEKLTKVTEPLTVDPLQEHRELYHPTPKHHHREEHRHRGHHMARIASIALLTCGFGSIGASLAIKTSQNRQVALISPLVTSQVLGTNTEKRFPYQTAIKIPASGEIPVHASPSISSFEVTSLNKNQTVYVFKVIGNWAQIGLTETDNSKQWWVNQQYLVQQ